MKKVYSVALDGKTVPFDQIHCENEESELQNLLEKNLDLIPGDQVDPDDPRRWLLVKREMMVEDPGTAEGRWSLDFLMVDQDGIPTLVECKRFRDTRARREVIGQMFDYAANASFYLNQDTLTQYLEEQARNRGIDIESYIASVQPSSGQSLETFLDAIQNNITQGQIRLVFFMEQSPPELRSIVAFLNSQMESTEVCLVEARQFIQNGLRVVVPTLWGYTEQARRIKKTVTLKKSGQRRAWNEEDFTGDLQAKLKAPDTKSVLAFYDFCRTLPGAVLKWGTGTERGSFSVTFPPAVPRSILSVFSDGELCLNFNWLDQSEVQLRVRDRFLESLTQIPTLDLSGQDPSKGRTIRPERWIPAVDRIKDAVRSALTEIR
jgi:hypothetical protein